MTSTNRCCHVKADIFERSLMVEVRIGQLLLLHYSNSDSYLGLKNSSSTNTNVCPGGGGGGGGGVGLKQSTITFLATVTWIIQVSRRCINVKE